jgi:hypothetical protein
MARCSLFVLQPLSFMLGVPEKANGLSIRRAILFDSFLGTGPPSEFFSGSNPALRKTGVDVS